MPSDQHPSHPGKDDDEQARVADDEWVGLLSEDGQWRWDGEQWQPVEQSSSPPAPLEQEPSETAPGAWPTPWGDLTRDQSLEPRQPEDSSPPFTRASLFGRHQGTPTSDQGETAPPAGPDEKPAPSPAQPGPEPPPLANRGLEAPPEEKEEAPEPSNEHDPAGPTRPVEGPAPYGLMGLEPPLVDPAPAAHRGTHHPHHGAPHHPTAQPESGSGLQQGPPAPPVPHHGGPHDPAGQAQPPSLDQGPPALPPSVPPAPVDDHPQHGGPPSPPSAPETSQEMTAWNPSPPAPPQAPEGPPTAASITSEQMLRKTAPAPDSGVRRVLFNVSGGRINLGPSGDDVRRRQLLALVRTRVNSCRRIAVISRKGGIGKTTTTLMLGHQFASVRGDRVVALDANPDAGSLADRVVRETGYTVTDILREGPRLVAYSDVRTFTSQAPSRLEVVATDNDPRISDALGEDDYAKVMDVLARHYSLILSDTGTGILDSATRGILNMADQIVLCAAPSLDASRVSASTLDWLDQHGYGHLASEAVVAINAVRPGGPVELDLLQKFFERRCRAVVRVPWDPRLSAGAETTLEELNPATRTAYLNLAAMVAAGFARP